MKRMTLALALVLGSAVACPVKAGYFANGQFKDTTGLTPLCTPAFRKISAEVKQTEYGEIYRTSLDLKGGFQVARAVNLFTAHGWKRLNMAQPKKGKAYAFSRAGKQTVLLVREGETTALIILIGDR